MARLSDEQERARSMVSSAAAAAGYCYSHVSSSSNPNVHLVSHHLQSFDSNSEIYNLKTGMELIGFPPKSLQQHNPANPSIIWKVESTQENIMAAAAVVESAAWHENRLIVDHHDSDSSLRCVFPCEGNERPSQGLSLSLCSSNNNTSSIGLQPFELRQQDNMVRLNGASGSRDGLFEKAMGVQQRHMMGDDFLGNAEAGSGSIIHYQGHLEIRHSKYLVPTRQLLNEFCSLGTKQSDHNSTPKTAQFRQLRDDNASCSALSLLELQKRKIKLLQMLEEVDGRYKHYCEQMRGVVSSFEAVAGSGAATVYSALASKAMSRHFRCLRDGIVDQLKGVRKAVGEKQDAAAAPGTTRGETPRLRILDQTLRQQKAFQHMTMMESHPWRPQRGLPDRSVSILRAWLFEHFLHPYPSDVDKIILARQTGLSRSQVSNWFINARVRLWKPMVEEMYIEELKEEEDIYGSVPDGDPTTVATAAAANQDQKPTADQLSLLDAGALYAGCSRKGKGLHHQEPNSSFPYHHHHHHQQLGGFSTPAGFELSATHQQQSLGGGVAYSNSFVGGGGVSLSLGLEQQGGSGLNGGFGGNPSQRALMYSKYAADDGQTVEYSMMDGNGGEEQVLEYRNLMGSQLLHDHLVG